MIHHAVVQACRFVRWFAVVIAVGGLALTAAGWWALSGDVSSPDATAGAEQEAMGMVLVGWSIAIIGVGIAMAAQAVVLFDGVLAAIAGTRRVAERPK